jgi:sugar-specific transcriptional regulator TrmB
LATNIRDVFGEYLNSEEIRVYGLIASGEYAGDPNGPEVQKLASWGFVTFHPDRPHIPVALDPDRAARRRVRAELEEAEARVARLKAIPDMSEKLSELYERAQWRAGGGSEFIGDAPTVNARLDDVIRGAQTEILAAQPGGPRTQEKLNRSVARDQEALARGVRLRTLYRDTVRDTAVTAEYARIMTGMGASYRTLVGPFERGIVVDRKVAFISNHVVEGAPEHAAWQITDRAMVGFIVAVFDDAWRRADLWHGELRGRGQQGVDTVSAAEGVRTSPRQREILRDLAAGIEQRATSGRLGISLRTVSDEVAALKSLFGAASLPELTYKWALSPDRLVDDSAPAAGAAGAEEETAA